MPAGSRCPKRSTRSRTHRHHARNERCVGFGVMTGLVPRRAARVLLLDAADRVLLFRGCDPARPAQRYWFTVGGGQDPGGTLTDCAVRELYEETGLRLVPE